MGDTLVLAARRALERPQYVDRFDAFGNAYLCIEFSYAGRLVYVDPAVLDVIPAHFHTQFLVEEWQATETMQ